MKELEMCIRAGSGDSDAREHWDTIIRKREEINPEDPMALKYKMLGAKEFTTLACRALKQRSASIQKMLTSAAPRNIHLRGRKLYHADDPGDRFIWERESDKHLQHRAQYRTDDYEYEMDDS